MKFYFIFNQTNPFSDMHILHLVVFTAKPAAIFSIYFCAINNKFLDDYFIDLLFICIIKPKINAEAPSSLAPKSPRNLCFKAPSTCTQALFSCRNPPKQQRPRKFI
ncbi:hypothetical protein LVJ78_10025 [Uruburuella suis]|uniref:Uncharacterized protein n=1 Tax=Uruburuella suis TaxID=252130 RepID=A0AAE9KGL5_9NEIS|nr:hypothetical protein [Uruburuella suis]UOO79020.1 hypothetical protein LVJ78_10025 [Uruburuella suis]